MIKKRKPKSQDIKHEESVSVIVAGFKCKHQSLYKALEVIHRSLSEIMTLTTKIHSLVLMNVISS